MKGICRYPDVTEQLLNQSLVSPWHGIMESSVPCASQNKMKMCAGAWLWIRP